MIFLITQNLRLISFFTRQKFEFVLALLMAANVLCIQNALGQNAKKNKVRLKVEYIKIMNDEHYIDVKTTARVDKQNINVPNIDLVISNEYNDDLVKLGKVTTNMNGEGRFSLQNLNTVKPDSTKTYNLNISFSGNDDYSRTSKSISFKDAIINSEIITKDSIHYIKATLIDAGRDSVIAGEPLNVNIQRLFKPLSIGEELNRTDENGTIIVPLEKGIPGVDGIITLEVVLKDSEDYGTVKNLITAPIGIPIEDKSTFDERTMWSPPTKTPLYLWIFPNILILGIWGVIILLIVNLYKINKF